MANRDSSTDSEETMRKIIENFAHHQDDYECMWNGLEDMYISKANENIPNQFFFGMSGFCSFVYVKINRADVKRMVSFNEGRPRQMYKMLSPIAGFDYRFIECKTPELALKRAKKEIDLGFPVVIGALDMYYLEYYPKLYHKYHVPFHYILMIGYDDDAEVIYLYDCGKTEMVKLSYANLFSAMSANFEGVSKPNTICTVRMDNPNSKKHIIKTALEYKANLFVNPPAGVLGINGMKKLAKEMPGWERELGEEEAKKIIRFTVNFLGSVPTTPNRLLGIAEEDYVSFMCSRDKMSRLLEDISREYGNAPLRKAGELFYKSGHEFEELCNIFVDHLLGNSHYRDKASKVVLSIADLEYNAFKLVLDGINAL